MSTTTTDRIEKSVLLQASRARVWQALGNAEAFGEWFGVKLTSEFALGARIRGTITHKGYEHVPFEITIERLEPEHALSWRWHPAAIEPGADYTSEPTTLVEFELHDAEDGTLLTVVESGFDAIPAARRAEAYRGNDEGWAGQMQAVEKYLSPS